MGFLCLGELPNKTVRGAHPFVSLLLRPFNLLFQHVKASLFSYICFSALFGYLIFLPFGNLTSKGLSRGLKLVSFSFDEWFSTWTTHLNHLERRGIYEPISRACVLIGHVCSLDLGTKVHLRARTAAFV